jgi:hypothetical protein
MDSVCHSRFIASGLYGSGLFATNNRKGITMKASILLLCVIGFAFGQTRIDLKTQSKTIDFSQATSTRPAKTGTVIPATCGTGEMFFKTDASAGQNMYLCVSTNTWLATAGGVASVFGRSGSVSAQEGDYSLTQMSDVSAKQGNGTVVQMFGGGTVTANDCAKFDANGNIVSAGAACGSGGGGGSVNLLAGSGIVVTTAGANTTVALDSAIVPSFLSVQGLLAFGSVSAQSCSDLSLTVSGAAENDSIAPGWPSTLPASLSGTMYTLAADTVRVRLCNATTAAVNVPNATFRATIIRSF